MLVLKDIDVSGQRVLCREDFNVPMEDGRIMDNTRIKRALPTIRYLLEKNAAVILLSHCGRPTPGAFDGQFSLEPVSRELSNLLNVPVRFEKEIFSGFEVKPGEVVLCENIRFQVGEKENDPELSRRLAKLCDIFVMDAFATAHRSQASTVGVAMNAPVAVAGPLLMEEVHALDQALKMPKKPLVAIVGGSKVSTKIQLLSTLLDLVDVLIVGGGIANTLLAAQGLAIGKSLYEEQWIDQAKHLIVAAQEKNVQIPLPTDVRVAQTFSKEANARVRAVDQVLEDEMILDIGPATESLYREILNQAGTVLWNGPVGVFEFSEFSQGTKAIATAIAESNAYSIAGGGDTISALAQFGLTDAMSYCSTGGGAFLEYVQGVSLPALEVLQRV